MKKAIAKQWSTAEGKRVLESGSSQAKWKSWGPYVAEREWGTVREDYSHDGKAWNHFPHAHARSRAYRWGEDGLAAICDRYQTLVFGLALWNGKDPILKERAFGLVPSEANHGEDVKECYYYLDSTPTHSYMKYLYKYPHAEFPYRQLIEENKAMRGQKTPEFELTDTGVFDEDRYFDVFVEYAKNSPNDIAIRIEICNRGPDPAPIHVLPTLWFRNQWAWRSGSSPQPTISSGPHSEEFQSLVADDAAMLPPENLHANYKLGKTYLYGDRCDELLFTNNETNVVAIDNPNQYGADPDARFTKDAFHAYVVNGQEVVNREGLGTKACFHYRKRMVPAGQSLVIRLRLTDCPSDHPLTSVAQDITIRRNEADAFYEAVHPPDATDDERRVQRQALAGMLWNKIAYLFDVQKWMDGDDPDFPLPESRKAIRNVHWRHLNSMRILSMPDKWEFPWFAAWDLAFHCVPLALVDPGFAKEQLWLLLFEQFIHPNGQIPAYEWEFSDINPPVHAWAVWRVYNMDRISRGEADREFLEQCFHKLLLNFTWWVNKVDSEGNNVFEGGFLGLDNITVIERSQETPEGAILEQSDATGWMGMYSLNMMRIALELAKENQVYEGLATKFFEHYVYIGAAMKNKGNANYQLWDEQDGFFYDVLKYPDGSFHKFRVRSLVGLVPLYAIERLEEDWIKPFKEFHGNFRWFLRNRKDLVGDTVTTVIHGGKTVHVLAIIKPDQMAKLLHCIWDPTEFQSPFGLRSLSKYHEKHPFTFGRETVRYEPGESDSVQKGGNSNWRGPIWFPTAFLMIESLRKLRKAYGHAFRIEDAADPSRCITLDELARQMATNLKRLFQRDENGDRPLHGGFDRYRDDPHWKDLILFYEHFDAESGRGIGASHQTGWTGLIASIIDEWR